MKKYMLRSSILSIATAVVLVATGCSSGGGGSTASTAVTHDGGAVDGYLQGATVFVDTTADGEHNSTEQSLITDTNGDFTLVGTITDGTKIYASGGIDRSTGYPFEGRLSALFNNSQETILSPLTTFVTALVDRNVSVEDATAIVAANLGIDPADVNKDPMTVPTVFLAAQKVQKTVEVITAATGEADFDAAYEDVFASLATLAEDNTTNPDFNATALVDQVQTDGAVINAGVADAVSTFLETFTVTIDEMAAEGVATDDLDTYGEVLNTYTEVVEGALEEDGVSNTDIALAVDDIETSLDDLNVTETVTAVEDGNFTDPLVDALAEVESAIDNNISYLGTNSADDNITANLVLTSTTAIPFDTDDLNLTWSSSNTAVITNSGNVNRSDTVDIEVQLKAAVNNSLVANNRIFDLLVKRIEYAPVVTADTNETISEDTNITDIDVSSNYSDLNGDVLTVTAVTAASNGTTILNAGVVSYVPNANYNGGDSFSYTVTDSTGLTANGTVNITVTPVNDAPIISGTPSVTVNQDSPYTFTPTVTDVDVNDTKVFDIVNKPMWADFNTTTGTLSGTPDNSHVGSTTGIVISVTDSGAASASLAAFDIAVVNLNDAPIIAGAPSVTVDEDSAYNFTPMVTDIDAGDTSTFAIINKPVWADFNTTTGTLSGTPDNSHVGTTTGIVISVTDSASVSASLAAFDITVLNVNDAPTASDGIIGTVKNVDASGILVANDVDVGDTLTFSIVDDTNASGTVTIDNSATGTYTYAPDANYTGDGSFAFIATDANGTASNTATVTISVVDAIISIVTANDANTINEDTNVTIDVLANDTSTNDTTSATGTGDTLGTIVSAVSTPANGTATIVSGEILYVPNANYHGTDTFTYTARTLSNNEANATVTVTVTSVDDPTVWNTSDTLSLVLEDFTSFTVDLNATDADGALTYSASTTGVVTASVSGSVLTISSKSGITGSETITVTADDGTNTSTLDISLSVNSTATDVWYDGKTLHGFWMDSDNGQQEIKYEDITLSGGDIVSSEYEYNTSSSTWILDSSVNSDVILNTSTGSWEASSETYVIDANNSSIMTINGYEKIRIDSVTDLSGLTIPFESEDGSVIVPVTFNAGALKYNISLKVIDDVYSLDWEPTDWDTGAVFVSLEEWMNRDGSFYWNEATGTGVQAKRDVTLQAAVDISDVNITTLSLNDTGKLAVIDWDLQTQTEVGTWTVVELPGQSVLSVKAVLDVNITNYDAYMEYGEKSATLFDADSNGTATVHMVEYQTVMADFVVDDEDTMGNAQAMDDIKVGVGAYDFSVFNVKAYFESGTKYFVNENGLMGNRTFFDNNSTYTGTVDGTLESGTYSVTNNIMTLIRDSDGLSFEFTYANPTEFGNGEMFLLSVNSNPAIETYNYDSEADRNDGMAAATADMRTFFSGQTRYYLSESGGTGFRVFSVDNSELVPPYTGTYTGNISGLGDVNGTYEIVSDKLILTRSTGVISLFEHVSTAPDGLSQVFDLSINGGTSFVTTNYVNEADRDAAAAALTFSADLGSITETEFIAITHSVTDPTGTWWYVEDTTNFESIIITSGTPGGSDGTVDFNETVDGTQGESGTIYYTVHTDGTYGEVVGLQESDGNATYVEYIKFFESMDQAALASAFPNITWSAGAAAVKNAGISNGESFDPWSDAGTFATVSYSDFDSLITGMTFGNSSVDDDAFLIGNGLDAIVFPTGTASGATTGDVVLSSDNTAVAGSFEIRNVDGISTLVVTITDSAFDDEHIAFQHDGTDMYRGEIYDRWSDILLNTIAKDDVMSFLAP